MMYGEPGRNLVRRAESNEAPRLEKTRRVLPRSTAPSLSICPGQIIDTLIHILSNLLSLRHHSERIPNSAQSMNKSVLIESFPGPISNYLNIRRRAMFISNQRTFHDVLCCEGDVVLS